SRTHLRRRKATRRHRPRPRANGGGRAAETKSETKARRQSGRSFLVERTRRQRDRLFVARRFFHTRHDAEFLKRSAHIRPQFAEHYCHAMWLAALQKTLQRVHAGGIRQRHFAEAQNEG